MPEPSDTPKKQRPSVKSLFEKLAAMIAPEPDSQSDLLDVMHDAHDRKLIDAECLAMIEGVFKVYDSAARDIMIPRTRMLLIDISQPIESWIEDVIRYGHSRYPAIDGDPEKVIGILFAKDLLKHYENGEAIRDILRPALFIPESKKLNVLLRDFKNTRNHLAIVIDEFGNVSGLVTIEDVLEEIVGEILDEYEDEGAGHITASQQDDGTVRWRVPAGAEMEDFNAELGLNLQDSRIDTIGGYVTSHLGYVPHTGENFDLDGLHFEVLRADAQKLKTLLVSRQSDTAL
ncbi:MAG: HlyC/CorC family transporter [Oxalobacter sp.]